jgi:hypothetical protein
MATYYLLPAPEFLEQIYERHLRVLFPGLRWSADVLGQVVAQVSKAAASHSDVYLIQQNELPEGADLVRSLVDGFGAEHGDEIIEMHAGPTLGEWRVRRRVVAHAV